MPDASHADVTRFVNAGLNREHTGKIDLVHLPVAAFDLPADFQLAAVEDRDGIHQRSERIVEQGRQHPAHLGAAVFGLDPGQDQVVMVLLHKGFQDCCDALAVRSVEGLVGDQDALVGAHGHLPAQHLFVLVVADGDDGDFATVPGGDLKGLFDRVVVRFIHRIDQVVSFDVVSGTVELNLVFRSVGYSSYAN